MLFELDRHLDNMAAAVTNKKAVLDVLVTTNAKITKLSSDKLARIKKLLLHPKSFIPLPVVGATTPASASNDCTVVQLRAAIKHKWSLVHFAPPTAGALVLTTPVPCAREKDRAT